jgi:hypothetical protein
MNSKNNNIFLTLSFSIILVITSCSGGGNRDISPEPFNINNIAGDWLFIAECDSALVLGANIFLAEQLPDTITISSDTDSTVFIDAGANNLIANIDLNGNFIIPNQTFNADVDLGLGGINTIPVSLNGSGSFVSNFGGSMDITFNDTILTQVEIDCTIDLRKLD